MIGNGLGHAATALAAGAADDFVVAALDDVDVADVDVFDEVAEFPQATRSTAVGTRSAAKIRFIRESNQTDRSHSLGYSTFASHRDHTTGQSHLDGGQGCVPADHRHEGRVST